MVLVLFFIMHMNLYYMLFLECDISRLIWAISPLSYCTNHCVVTNIQQWIEQVHKSLNIEDSEFFITTCWAIWNNRNKVVHESVVRYESAGQRFIARYKQAQTVYSSPLPPDVEQPWVPPEARTIKVNFRLNKSGRCECCIFARNRSSFPFVTDVVIDEALQQVIIEGDSKNVITQLQATTPSLSTARNIIEETKTLSLFFSCCLFFVY